MPDNFYGKSYRIFRTITRLFYPRYQPENADQEAHSIVYVSHHERFRGPLSIMLWTKKPIHIWALSVFCEQQTCCRQIIQYPFVQRFGWNKKAALIICLPLSYIISALVRSANAIPVYRGSREIVKTFRQSVDALVKGDNVLIFPDVHYDNRSALIGEIDPGFLHLEKYYYKKTKKHLVFVPVFASKSQQKIVHGNPVTFQDGVDFKIEQERVKEALRSSLTQLAYKCGDGLTSNCRKDVAK
ncbi:glycerol acyltransferase [Bacillus sp. AGMB 02131]|uniref:Glycerol acyltransferase n=1 Tax=Peribacillus faecalis TaxID=2772559 RepID=A0A927CXY9_9BACI|nr:glycerol acyltransferase [Peribacillus faecalis]MBD3109189.1 glycerol acyltransferase [Peribacillus faecalis]